MRRRYTNTATTERELQTTQRPEELSETVLDQLHGGGDADDRPTEEVAFY